MIFREEIHEAFSFHTGLESIFFEARLRDPPETMPLSMFRKANFFRACLIASYAAMPLSIFRQVDFFRARLIACLVQTD
jgi:hypothetical protein